MPAVLVVGGSGLVGTAAVDVFASRGWEVVAVSRSGKPDDRPNVTVEPLDLLDTAACEAFVAAHPEITHVVYAALFELPGLIEGWKDEEQMTTNREMLRNVLEPLSRTGRLEHISVLQGTKAYGLHFHPIRTPSRESEPRDDHPNFYWLQEDLVRELSATAGFAFTIFRPTLVVGPNIGGSMNVSLVIGAYGALQREAGLPMPFPGGVEYVQDAVDARLIGSAAEWAATAPTARNEIFNLHNGEVFTWRDLWPSLADALGVETAPDEPRSMVEYFRGRDDEWAALAAKHSLAVPSLSRLLGESPFFTDFQFAAGLTTPPAPAIMSTIKLHEAGFHEVRNTTTTFVETLERLQRMRVLPER